jgi:hypothetical protein
MESAQSMSMGLSQFMPIHAVSTALYDEYSWRSAGTS